MALAIPVSYNFLLNSAWLEIFQESSHREQLSAHAEVLALQDQLGISYKDASHHLYMAELEKVTADQRISKAFSILQASTEKAFEKAYKLVKDMDSEGERDIDQVDDRQFKVLLFLQ